MSGDTEREDELREAAEALAVQLGYAKRARDGARMIDCGTLEGEDDDDVRAAIERLVAAEDDMVAAFDGNGDLALEWVQKVFDEAGDDDP